MNRSDPTGSIIATSRHRTRLAAVILAAAFVVLGFSGTAGATVPDSVGTTPSDSTTVPPATDAPDDTFPNDNEVPSEETSEEADEGLDAAPIAIVGFVILLAIASWWMVRRDDADDQPSPPPPGEPEWRADQIAP